MTAKELKRIFQKGECLSLDTMRLYNDGKLNKKSMHEVEKHLLECGLCAAAIDGLSSRRISEVNKLTDHIQRRLAVYMNTPPRIPFFRRFGFTMIAGLLFLSGGATWWYLAQDEKKETPKITDSATGDSYRPSILPLAPTSSQSSAPVETVSLNSTPPVSSNSTEKTITGSSDKVLSLPADQPGQSKTLTTETQTQSTPNKTTDPDNNSYSGGPNTREASTAQMLRIKNIQVYMPVTHNDKSGRKESKDGQLGRTGSSDASFQLSDMPSYPGGDEALRKFIFDNFKPTTVDRSKLTRYATGVRFIVNSKTGVISAPELSFSISPEVDAELLRVISLMPAYYPGKKRGEVDIMLGITFE